MLTRASQKLAHSVAMTILLTICGLGVALAFSPALATADDGDLAAGGTNLTVQSESQAQPSVEYRTHVQNVSWQGYVANGAMSGTSGKSLRLEGINVRLANQPYPGDIEYRTHIQNIGWETSFKKNDEMSGTSGRALRLEAIQIRLTGEMAERYDVYYRVHCQNFGWMGWAKDGAQAGSAGYAYRLEGIEIRLVPKGDAAPGTTSNAFRDKAGALSGVPDSESQILYRTHVQNVGWQNFMRDGEMAGTSGRSLRLEGINIKLGGAVSGGIRYATHVQNIGWQDWRYDGAMSGTSGRSLRLEAIKIELTGEAAEKYDVYYRVHCQNLGWMGWAKNGAQAGSEGYAYRLEGIEIRLVPKGSAAPGSTENAFRMHIDIPGNSTATKHVTLTGTLTYVPEDELWSVCGVYYLDLDYPLSVTHESEWYRKRVTQNFNRIQVSENFNTETVNMVKTPAGNKKLDPHIGKHVAISGKLGSAATTLHWRTDVSFRGIDYAIEI